MSKLTDTQIKNAKSKDKQYSLSDGLGLSLLINPNGSKWWRYRFQFNCKAKIMSLGTYPDITLAAARKILTEARTMVAQGINPIDLKQEEKIQHKTNELKKITFKEVKDAYLLNIRPNVSTHHYDRSESLLRLYAEPIFNDMQMEDITKNEIKAVVFNLVDMGKQPSAKKLFGVLKQVFDHAEDRGYIEDNICNLINTKNLTKGHTAVKSPTLTKPEDIKLLLENIENYTGHWANKRALQFMALTSLRSANIRHALWNQIDFKNKTMTIDAKDMKNKEEFVLPLATQTMDLLKSIKPLSGHGKYIFPSTLGDRALSENAMLTAIRRLGYTKEEFTPHGFRAMFATIANDHSSFSREIIDVQLAHKVGDQVSQAYNRADYFDKRVELVQWWADWLNSL